MILTVTDFLTTSVVLPLVALSVVCYHRGFSPVASVNVPVPIKGNSPTRSLKEERVGGGDTRALNTDAQRALPPAYAVSQDPSTISVNVPKSKEGYLYSPQACTQEYTSDDIDEPVVVVPIPATTDSEKNTLFSLSPPPPIPFHKPTFLLDPETTPTTHVKRGVNNRVSELAGDLPNIPSPPPEYRPLRRQQSSPLDIRVRSLRPRTSFYDTSSKTIPRKPQGNPVPIHPEPKHTDEDEIEIELETTIIAFGYSEMLLDIRLPPPYEETSGYETEMWVLTNEMVDFWQARKKKEKKLRVRSSTTPKSLTPADQELKRSRPAPSRSLKSPLNCTCAYVSLFIVASSCADAWTSRGHRNLPSEQRQVLPIADR